MADPNDVDFLRHAVATLAYRAEKVLRELPDGFGERRVAETSRSAAEITAHLGDLAEWAAAQAEGDRAWKAAGAGSLEGDVARFFAGLERLDATLAAGPAEGFAPRIVFQGPIADGLTHVGQLALLRRLSGAPVRPESYVKAQVEVGRVGRDQSDERREFDGDASKR